MAVAVRAAGAVAWIDTRRQKQNNISKLNTIPNNEQKNITNGSSGSDSIDGNRERRDRRSTIFIGGNKFNIRHNNNDGIAQLRLTMRPESYHMEY